MSETQESKQVHQQLVQSLVNYMRGEDWNVVHAEGVSGCLEPFEIGGATPNIVAKRNDGLIAVGKVETCRTLNDEATLKQFTALSGLSTTSDKRDVPLYLAVPASCITQLVDLIEAKYADKVPRITCVQITGI